MAGVRSASIGVWVGVGSRDETPDAARLLALPRAPAVQGHPRSGRAMDISVALDAVGGEFNAFTAKEYTCFHARVLDDDLPLAVDVLGDMVTGSLLAADDVEAERDVILDEIAMHDDDPDDVVHNLFAEQAWGSGAARPPDRRHDRLDRDDDPRAGRALLPAPLPAGEHRRRRRPATSTTPRSSGSVRALRAQRLPDRRRAARRPRAPATRPPRARRQVDRAAARSSRSTWCSASTG